ncbi:MAG: tryptophan--tRNA ligase, partial [Lachnospiraceae bacterium]|nr:tryptophan--tRNA ligase [Lachnospiraceae bacterium]
GEDQKQHVELTRDLAIRFNNIYGDVFRVPEPYISKVGARIYGLSTPGNKMSKSEPEGCVFLMDDPNVIMKKFKRAVTDSDTENCVHYDKVNKPGVSNLINIYATLTGKTFEEIEKEFEGQGYGVFKPAVGDAVVQALTPIREEAQRLIADKTYLENVYREGAQRASYVANKTLRKVYKKVGFYQLP